MRLQAERGTTMHMDAFDVKPPADDQAFKPALGAMIFGKLHRLGHGVGPEDGDRRLDLLRPRPVGHQNRIAHCHGDTRVARHRDHAINPCTRPKTADSAACPTG